MSHENMINVTSIILKNKMLYKSHCAW